MIIVKDHLLAVIFLTSRYDNQERSSALFPRFRKNHFVISATSEGMNKSGRTNSHCDHPNGVVLKMGFKKGT